MQFNIKILSTIIDNVHVSNEKAHKHAWEIQPRDAESLFFVGLWLYDLLCDTMIMYLRMTWEKF